jgi:hypothetical protein
MNNYLSRFFSTKTFEADTFRVSASGPEPEEVTRGGGSSAMLVTYVKLRGIYYLVRDPKIARYLQGLASKEQELELLREATAKVDPSPSEDPEVRTFEVVRALEEMILKDAIKVSSKESELKQDAQARFKEQADLIAKLTYEGNVYLDSLQESARIAERNEAINQAKEAARTKEAEEKVRQRDEEIYQKTVKSVDKWVDTTLDNLLNSLEQARKDLEIVTRVAKPIISSERVRKSYNLLSQWSRS